MERWDYTSVEADFGQRLEAAAEALGLIFERHDLKSLPRNQHWHMKKPGMRGVLEATWLLDKGEAWLSQHSNRGGDWIAAAVAALLDAGVD